MYSLGLPTPLQWASFVQIVVPQSGDAEIEACEAMGMWCSRRQFFQVLGLRSLALIVFVGGGGEGATLLMFQDL